MHTTLHSFSKIFRVSCQYPVASQVEDFHFRCFMYLSHATKTTMGKQVNKMGGRYGTTNVTQWIPDIQYLVLVVTHTVC